MPATIWRGRLVFGLVSIPVRLHKAARRDRVRFHNVYRPSEASVPEEVAPEEPAFPEAPGRSSKVHPFPRREPAVRDEVPEPEPVARVHHASVGAEPEIPLRKENILKGYEIEPDRYVALKPSEIAALRPRTSTELEIAEFVRLNEIDPVFFDASYFVSPDRGGEKPYALLYRALAETGYVAVGAFAMHGREHAALIRPGAHGLVLHTLFYANEVGREESPAGPNLVSEKELDLAKALISALSAPFDAAKLKDQFEERLRQFIESRAATAVPAAAPNESRQAAPVVDIMEALRQSLAAARKPARSEPSSRPGPRKERRRAK